MRILKVIGMAALAGALKAFANQLPNIGIAPDVGNILAVALAAAAAYMLPPPKKRQKRAK